MATKSRAEYQRKWRNKNKAKELSYHRAYRDKNREKRREWNREWINSNRERYNASKYKYRDKMKREALEHYGGVMCVRCGIDDIDVLCLDHINDDGAAHRKAIRISGRSTSGTNTYEAVRREGYPEGLQVLCANCNLKKEIERKRRNRLNNPFYKYGEVVP